ncbi:hypothetical protein L207DRAFT_511813 [Hyaloscypha variabilis F]|uniref:SsuA/THI5-like domain-containing protein n=1 Tax=Hyaloscypha variabilis (strain UAMH 11265 / GT02V1 / F) TaxID=1149755 RepID=A0A2J6RP52_HYAVF|nr:hypothetical protein L207DRAFT_511813 [Hyaloscypha variabilis F]
MATTTASEPSIERSLTLNFIGDWGQANFHRICSWLTQEFCDRAGPRSRVGIWNMRGGGLEGLEYVHSGEAQLCIATPAMLLPSALTGEGLFAPLGPMPSLRALAALPQRDRMMLAIHPKFGIHSYADLHRVKPALRIATSSDDGTNFIGYVAMRLMEAHGITKEVLESWGGSYVFTTRPEQAIENMRVGNADAVLQEAIMTPWWRQLMEEHKLVPIPAQADAIARLTSQHGWQPASIRAGFWNSEGNKEEIPALDFSDFLVVVRDDLPDDVAYLLTWCLVEQRGAIEAQYKHIEPERSPLSYPLEPAKMAKPSLPLHPGAERYYKEHGHLAWLNSRVD